MKPIGIILIIAGILMFIFSNTRKKMLNSYAGGIAAICGVVVVLASRKKA